MRKSELVCSLKRVNHSHGGDKFVHSQFASAVIQLSYEEMSLIITKTTSTRRAAIRGYLGYMSTCLQRR